LASFEGPIEDIDSGTGGLRVFHSERSNKASALFMAISDQITESWQAPSFSPPRGSARNRIIPAAAHVLQTEPDNFSVQRVARRAGISARAIYGHFSSGAELASAARMLMLQEMIERLPAQVNPVLEPREALRRYARSMADVFRPENATWMMLGRQDEAFMHQYRRVLRRPLVQEVELYLQARKAGLNGGPGGTATHAEIFVMATEGIAITHAPQLALNLELTEALDWFVNSFCAALRL
jgi:AcrR family transcriptional regulator